MNRYKSNLYQSHLSGLYVVTSFLSGSFACLPLFWVLWCCDYFKHSFTRGKLLYSFEKLSIPKIIYKAISLQSNLYYSGLGYPDISIIRTFFSGLIILNIYIHLFDHSDSWLSGVSSPVFTSPDNQGSTVYAIWDNIFDFSLKMILYLRCY